MIATVEVSDRTIAYWAAGEPARGTVLALHSLGTDHRLWSHLWDRLTELGFRVLCPDARGHGRSSWTELVDAGGWVEDVEAVLDAEGADVVDLLGVSMGCAQALEQALHHPQRVRSLVVSGAFGTLPPAAARAKADGLVEGARADGMAAWADRYTATTLFSDDPRDSQMLRDAISGVSLEAYAASARACFAPRSGDLSTIEAPSLVVWGDRDEKTPYDMGAALAEELGDADIAVLPGAGHLATLDAPRAYGDLVSDFLLRIAV